MSRLPNIPSGNGSSNPSAPCIDVPEGKIYGASLQNVSAVDIYVSEDRTRLDATAPGTNLPQAGILLSAVAQAIWVIPRIKGPYKLYIRAQNVGAQAEVIIYPIC
jgi:hypothetical protein